MTNKEHPFANIKPYYGYANELPADDPRMAKYVEQYKEHGFDDTDTWNLDTTLVRFMLPRLKRFKEVNNGYPSNLTEQSWNDIIDKMIHGFELHLKDACSFDAKIEAVIAEAFELFALHLRDLWW